MRERELVRISNFKNVELDFESERNDVSWLSSLYVFEAMLVVL